MNVTIGIPLQDSCPAESFYNLMLLVAKIARTERICIPPVVNVSPHDRARCLIFEAAEKNHSDYVCFFDDDMIIPDTAFCDMLECFTLRKPRPVVVSGHYYRRGYPYTSVWSLENPEKKDEWLQVDADSGVHQIHISGFGCCMIDMKWVLENLEKPYSYQKSPAQVTDDVTFFEQVKSKGGLVLGNANIRCGHLGERVVVCDRTATQLRKNHIEITQLLEKGYNG